MSEQRRLAVVLVRNDASAAYPPVTIEQATRLMLSDQSSVFRYWDENAEGWFTFSRLDFFGSYDVTLPPPQPPGQAKTSRGAILDVARAAAQNAGVDLAPYDGLIVFVHPGSAGGVGYDAGTHGAEGPGSSCILPTTGDRTFFCHEIGHALGFFHTYGLLNTGADWSGTGERFEVYGDPYDLMSSAAFGAADPTLVLTPDQAIDNFPNALKAGPMLSRANLHFAKPAALEATGRVRHIYEGGDSSLVTLHPAGHRVGGDPELLVYHPIDEDPAARGRVYVEYRQPFDFNWSSRWDGGLSNVGTERDNCGLVVHVVKDIPEGTATAVWYAGRIVFPCADADLRVDTSRGLATVTVSQESVQQEKPGYVRVRVGRAYAPWVSIKEAESKVQKVLSSERRLAPGWEWAGPFTWERRQTLTTATYTPVVYGLGGAGTTDGPSAVDVNWYVGDVQPVGLTGVASVHPEGVVTYVDLDFSIDPETGVLLLSDHPSVSGFVVKVRASASDDVTWRDPIKADTTFTGDGVTEGWGTDYKRFMDMWDRITHPIPKQHFGVPKPDDYRVGIDRLVHAYEELRLENPEVAANVQPLVLDQVRVLQRMISG
ncbi:hypothetical protein [Terrabacter sp. Ter38]|uniref:hypothetical protein n=1 Tax=Terrabacter sp. Ter38 TaxID=2926030 RepID=UPI0021173AE6|nr:hypothetical protein [Terrabacter sp. Ter38]